MAAQHLTIPYRFKFDWPTVREGSPKGYRESRVGFHPACRGGDSEHAEVRKVSDRDVRPIGPAWDGTVVSTGPDGGLWTVLGQPMLWAPWFSPVTPSEFLETIDTRKRLGWNMSGFPLGLGGDPLDMQADAAGHALGNAFPEGIEEVLERMRRTLSRSSREATRSFLQNDVMVSDRFVYRRVDPMLHVRDEDRPVAVIATGRGRTVRHRLPPTLPGPCQEGLADSFSLSGPVAMDHLVRKIRDGVLFEGGFADLGLRLANELPGLALGFHVERHRRKLSETGSAAFGLSPGLVEDIATDAMLGEAGTMPAERAPAALERAAVVFEGCGSWNGILMPGGDRALPPADRYARYVRDVVLPGMEAEAALDAVAARP